MAKGDVGTWTSSSSRRTCRWPGACLWERGSNRVCVCVCVCACVCVLVCVLKGHGLGHRRIANDSFHTDVCLLYPPYLTALACVFLAVLVAETVAPSTDGGVPGTPAFAAVAAAAAAAGGDDPPLGGAASLADAAARNAASPAVAQLRTWFANLHVDLDEVRRVSVSSVCVGGCLCVSTHAQSGAAMQIAEVTQHLVGLYVFWAAMEGDSPEVSVADVLVRLRGTSPV
jgi:hypothetical protein